MRGIEYTHADRERLREAYRTGGRGAAFAAFPDRSRDSVISAIARHCEHKPAPSLWEPAEIQALLDADRRMSYPEVLATFSHRSESSVHAALRRYRGSWPKGEPAPLADRNEIAKKLAEIPFEQFFERLKSLLMRRADFESAQ